jgi:gamma-glutamylcyclotransferase (GGCT)/AIG2-like uncharacterized protein YtfP
MDSVDLNAMEKVFVYGSLRRHEGNHRVLGNSEKTAMQASARGRLYDTGDGFPAMALIGEGRVYGELYSVTPHILKRLDTFEGYYGAGPNNHYERVVQTITTDTGEMDAYVYIYSVHKVASLTRIEFGDWTVHRLLQRVGELNYFSYASCMDDERFKLAGKEQLFRNVLGRGVLTGYDMKFLRKSIDNTGKADLVEVGGEVEGKVYRIGGEALEYLLVREGVRANAYRPAFVDVRVGGRLRKNVLTFLAVGKQKKEVAPSDKYLEEIRRGGRTVWSTEYERRFEEKIRTVFPVYSVR